MRAGTIDRLALLAAVLMAGCAQLPPEERLDNVPMYGQPAIVRPEAFLKADEAFIASAVAKVGDRKTASIAWAVEGDRYMRERNMVFAMRRYNQAWLLDPENFWPFWGFARVALQRDQFDESLRFFDIAKALRQDPHQRPALLSDNGVAYMWKAESLPSSAETDRRRYFALANAAFADSVALDGRYYNAYLRWAESLAKEGDLDGAWRVVQRARDVGAPAFPSGVMQTLRARMPEPEAHR